MSKAAATARSPDDQRRKELKAWIAGGMAYHGLTAQKLSEKTGMAHSTLTYRMRYPETIRKDEEWAIARVIGGYEDGKLAEIYRSGLA